MAELPVRTGDSSPTLRQGWLWLCLAVLLVYAQTASFEFSNYDDTTYITRNPQVIRGLTPDAVRQAFTGDTLGMWHPLTSLSHIVDWQLFGPWAGGHHAVNVLLHALNTGFLFVLLRRMTGAGWPSFVVALLFALHPLNVESVAWASQRKSVLSALFFMLTLLAWQRYTARKSWPAYWLALGLYGCGLMSKPMLVTLPGILLLLDVWPLARIQWSWRDLARLLLEKVPFIVLALVTVVILLHPWSGSAAATPEPGFSGERWLRALANNVVYLRKLVWPSDLAVLYPHRPVVPVPVRELAGATIVLVALTALAWRGRWPLLVGWLWFLGTLFPVSGVMPIGPHELADRYAYLPTIGIFLMAAWLVPARVWMGPRRQVGVVVAVAGLGLGIVAWWQAGFWRNSLTLWSRAVELYPPSIVQQMNYGNALSAAGRTAEAEVCFERVAALRPDDPLVLINLATIRNQRGEREAAIGLLERALQADAQHAGAHALLGSFLHDAGKIVAAQAHLETAIRLDPDLASARLNLGVLLAQQGDLVQAERMFAAATRIQPDDVVARQNLALVRTQLAAADKPASP